MHEYRKLTQQERQQLVHQRLERGYPPHSPPHPIQVEGYYLLSATCYSHQHHMSTAARRQTVLDRLFENMLLCGVEVAAWVILPNHYHVLVYVTEFAVLETVFKQVHGSTSYDWNGEENARGRKVWYRYTDRKMRNLRHYFTTLNYIHYNPVRHHYVSSPYDWKWSSVHWYLDQFGREGLRDLWVRYPLLSYGDKWDQP